MVDKGQQPPDRVAPGGVALLARRAAVLVSTAALSASRVNA
jgi:hypothetical protein